MCSGMSFRISLRHSCSLLRLSGSGTSGMDDLMLQAVFGDLERRRHREDRLAVLDGHHAPRGEGLAVAAAIHLVDDGHPGIARAQEISVQRVADALVHGARGRDQRLAQDLAAEDALPAVLGRNAAEDVVLDTLKVEQRQQLGQSLLRAVFGRGVAEMLRSKPRSCASI